jgi:ABC-type lipoprotein release transport system permease subunit
MERTLYEVRAHDPSTFVMVALVLFAVSIAAQAVPTLRALRIEPNEVLRQE